MIILQSQIDSIALDTLHIVSSPHFIQTPFIELETVHLTYTPIQSPSLGLIQLEKLTLTLTPKTIPTPLDVVISLAVAHLTYTAEVIGIVQETGCELTNIIATLRQGGSARVTPARFVDCDAMDIIDAVRAGTTKPTIPYDATDMLSSLLNALDAGNGIPFSVPVIGTWCGTDPEYPEVVPVVANAFFRIKGDSHQLGFPSNYTIQISTDYAITWASHPHPAVDFVLDFYYGEFVYAGGGVILLHPTSNSGSAGIIYKSGANYGLSWIKVDISSIVTRRLTGMITGFSQGLEDSQTVFGFTKETDSGPLLVVKSVNRGYNWTVVVNQSANKQVGSMVMLSEDIILMTYTSGTRYIAKSIDGGLTWVDKYSNSLYINAPLINMGGGIVLWVNTDTNTSSGTIARSVDYGETWTDVLAPVLGGYHTEGVSLGNGVALINQYNSCCGYRTDDYGLTWTKRVFESLSSYPVKFFNCRNGKVIARWGGSGGNVKYSVSSNYGLTWTDVAASPWDNNYYTSTEVFIPY